MIQKLTLCFYFLFLSFTTHAQFFSYEILEGHEYVKAGFVHCKIMRKGEEMLVKLETQLPRNTKLPNQVAQSNSLRTVYHMKITQKGSLLTTKNNNRYTTVRDEVYQSDSEFRCKTYKDPFELAAWAKLSTFENDAGYGEHIFKIKLRVYPVYFDQSATNATTDQSIKETYKAAIQTSSKYYPKLTHAVKIYIARNGKRLKKPAGYREEEFKLVSKYQYKGKTIHSNTVKGSSLNTPFFNKEKNEDYYIKLIDKGLIIHSNEVFAPGKADITVLTEVYKNGKSVFKEQKLVSLSVPKFSSYSFKVVGMEMLPDGIQLFKKNSKWNNQGRDPLPDLVCKVSIDGVQIGKTAENENAFQSAQSCTVKLHYIEGKTIPIKFVLIDEDSFLNPDDVLLTKKQDLTDFMKNKPTQVSDNYIGRFTLVH